MDGAIFQSKSPSLQLRKYTLISLVSKGRNLLFFIRAMEEVGLINFPWAGYIPCTLVRIALAE